jgi:hypothetical protein
LSQTPKSIARTISADDLPDNDPQTALRSLYLRDNDSRIVRPLSKLLTEMGMHFRDRDVAGTARPFACIAASGDPCVACLAGKRAVATYLGAVLDVPTRSLCALSLGDGTGPDSLQRQLAQVLRLADFSQKLLEISLHRRKYTVKILRTIAAEEDGPTYGLDVIREGLARDAVNPDALAATVDRLTNAEMLDEWPALRGEIALRHPGIDIDAL